MIKKDWSAIHHKPAGVNARRQIKDIVKEALKKNLNAMWKDESAQGMVEYILILVAVIGFVMLIRRRLGESLNSGLDNVNTGIQGFTVDQ